MSSIRQNKIARLIQRDLGEIMQRNGGGYTSGGMITVTIVRISPDLGYAKVYLSIFAVKDKQEALEKVVMHNSEIRGELGKRIKNQLRQVPELHFYLDDSLDYAENIDNLLKT